MKQFILPALLTLLAGPLAAAETTAYVQSAQAKLYAEANFKSAVLAVLPKGESVLVQEKDKRWYRIKHGEQSGWISHLLLSNQPPMDKITVLDGEEEPADIPQDARRRASSNNTAAATRGLREGSRARLSSEGQEDYGAVEQMEAKPVTDAEAVEFLRQGQQP